MKLFIILSVLLVLLSISFFGIVWQQVENASKPEAYQYSVAVVLLSIFFSPAVILWAITFARNWQDTTNVGKLLAFSVPVVYVLPVASSFIFQSIQR